MVRAESISKVVTTSSGDLKILDTISLCVDEGASLSITGESGSGKSTLLGILAGLDLPSEGRVHLSQECITDLDEEMRADVRARYVGFVFQSFQLLPGLTALENVMLPLELYGVANAEDEARNYLKKVGLDHRLGHYPKQLSGGEQQRVAIARAFANQPKILFADEPTGNLDSKTGETIINLLFDLNAELGTTLILVTHEQRLAQRCSNNIELSSGKLI